ncbi:alpha/beta hydrolase-fold protein [Lachnospiraceae bacterium 62-35]
MILRGSVPSAVLGMDTGLTVIVPGSYRDTQDQVRQPYKVAYLLHGLYGNHQSWSDYTMLPDYASNYEIVFIMPEAGRSFYTNMTFGLDYFTYISQELPQICKKTFFISDRREDTFIIGGSAGGYGALKCALDQPDIFGHCMAFSSAGLFLKKDLEQLREEKAAGAEAHSRLWRDMRAVFGENLECSLKDELLSLADMQLKERRNMPNIFMLCGSEDPYLEENRWFAAEMKKRNRIPFSYQEIPGGHDWSYFNQALQTGLQVKYSQITG